MIPSTNDPSHQHAAAAPEPWYARTWATVLFLVFLAPLGIFLMWKHRPWGRNAKIAASLASAAFFIASLTSNNSSDKATATASSPAPKRVAARPEAAPKPVAQAPKAVATPTAKAAPAKPTPEPLPDNVTVQDIKGVGKRQVGTVDEVDYVVVETERMPAIGSTQADGMFYVLRVGAYNNAKETHSAITVGMKLVDDQEREFTPSSDGGFALAMSGDDSAKPFTAQLQPGTVKRFTLVYDAPADAKGLKLKIPAGTFSMGGSATIAVPK
ncbi:MAG TPA: DUF4352 domain-containing protein [Abditibacteriaceae bacterium]|jgi:hypothetical protein